MGCFLTTVKRTSTREREGDAPVAVDMDVEDEWGRRVTGDVTRLSQHAIALLIRHNEHLQEQ